MTNFRNRFFIRLFKKEKSLPITLHVSFKKNFQVRSPFGNF
jgi:hypothetical protein